jgi:hypothetical protein
MDIKTNYCLEVLRASEGTFTRWSRLHLQSLAPTNPYWASVVGYGLLCIIHKESLYPSSGGINKLMLMMASKKIKLKLFLFPMHTLTKCFMLCVSAVRTLMG